jgi:hypothetical protein
MSCGMSARHDLFENSYPEFFHALAALAFPDDIDRIREAHSDWRAHNPCEYPPLCTERGWAAPEVGEAFKNLWLASENQTARVRTWRRAGKDGPYEVIDPSEWRRRRRIAMEQARSFPQQPPKPGFIAVSIRPPVLGDVIDPHIPVRDFFIVFAVNEIFLRDVVVSRSDFLKAFPAKIREGQPAPILVRHMGGHQQAERLVPILNEMYPAGRPPLLVEEVRKKLEKRSDVDQVSKSTVERAYRLLGWTRKRTSV